MVRQWMRIASFGASLTTLAVLAVAIPSSRWTPVIVTAALLVCLSIAGHAIVPAPMPRDTRSDAPQIFLIGPMVVLHALMVALSAAALWLALSGVTIASWVADVLWLGLVFVGYAALQASTRVVAQAATQTSDAADDPRSQWAATLRKLSVQAEQEPTRRLLEGLAERVRFAARTPAGRPPAETESISLLINQLEQSMTDGAELNRLARSAEVLLEQREQALRAFRTRA